MTLATICLPVQEELRAVEAEIAKNIGSEVNLVNQAASYVLQDGGKRIRPALTLLAAKMIGIEATAVIPLGAAVEMIHAASLMHDDVLDNASVRRGKPSINAKWGNQISILVGDFLWCRASSLVIKYGNAHILQLATEAVEHTTRGEILEIVRSNDFNVTEEEYLNIIKLKTASLFACACKMGAVLTNASHFFQEALDSYGTSLGIAFQLADDVLDYVSNEEQFGKKAGIDLSGGKLTLPLILALKRCCDEERTLIKNVLLANSFDAGHFEEVKIILNKYGAIEESRSRAKLFISHAKEAISPFKPSLSRESLLALADHAIMRGR